MTVSHGKGRLIMSGSANSGLLHLLLSFSLGSFWAGLSKSDAELLYHGKCSPNLLAVWLTDENQVHQ